MHQRSDGFFFRPTAGWLEKDIFVQAETPTAGDDTSAVGVVVRIQETYQ